jgi:3-hydroxyisobutyrate dehydrogenase-like beta-hydroxyacid dehydrogenase
VQVAVMGMGRMGAAMAARLAQDGAEVAVWNRSPAKAEAVARETGTRVLATARDAGAYPFVVSSLADDAALTTTYLGDQGLVAGLADGTVVVETSTVDPRTIEELAPGVAERGAQLLDAPVSGSVPAVQGGTLTFMVGGDAGALDRARPVIDVLAGRTFHLGATGTGAAMKLAVNSMVHALHGALSEALVLAEAAGIARGDAYEVFLSSVAGAPFLQYKRAVFEDPEGAPTAFSLDLVAKDLTLIATLADRLGVPLSQGATNLEVARAAVEGGDGAHDMSWLAQRLRTQRD